MGSNVVYRSVNLSQNEDQQFRSELEQFSDFCSSDSTVTANLSKDTLVYHADVSIRHQRGHIAVRIRHSNFMKLIEDCFSKLYGQMKIWRDHRFEEPFHLEQSNEWEHLDMCASDKNVIQDTKGLVLIVDDDLSSSSILERLFQHEGYRTKVVSDSTVAVYELGSLEYDLIVLDWCLPYMEGHDVIHHAEAALMGSGRGGPRKQIPVITCSGLSKDQIQWPESRTFYQLDHWEKSQPLSTVISSVSTVTEKIENLQNKRYKLAA